MEEIITSIAKLAIALAAITLYIYLIGSVYPWAAMRLVWNEKKYPLRGLRKVKYEGGRGVVYTTSPKQRRYINKFAVYVQNGEKYVRCSIAPQIRFMRYDVISFDIRDRVLDVVSVNEHIVCSGVTDAVRVPTATAYAYVVARSVDKMYVSEDKILSYSLRGTLIYAALCVVSCVACAWFIYEALTSLILLLEPWLPPLAAGVLMGRAVIYGVIAAALAIFAYYRHSVKVINR